MYARPQQAVQTVPLQRIERRFRQPVCCSARDALVPLSIMEATFSGADHQLNRSEPLMHKRLVHFTFVALLLGASTLHADENFPVISTPCAFGECQASISFTYLGDFVIPTGSMEYGIEFGGISGIEFDAASGRYIAISDDRSEKGPARFYELDIDVSHDGLKGVRVNKHVAFLNAEGNAFSKAEVDPEAIRISPDGIYWSSEGGANPMSPPSVQVASRSGEFIRQFSLPAQFFPTADKAHGVRENLSFENLAVAPSGDVFVGTEAALFQDGDVASLTKGSLARIIRYDGSTGTPKAQYIYPVSPIPQAPDSADGANDNGASDMIALNDRYLLVVERNFSQGFGNNVKVFMIDVEGATDVSNITSLAHTAERVVPVRKSQVLDLRAIGLTPDNIEGIAVGKAMDGSDVLILAADNNFSKRQKSQFFAFKIDLPKMGG